MYKNYGLFIYKNIIFLNSNVLVINKLNQICGIIVYKDNIERNFVIVFKYKVDIYIERD